MTHALIGLFLIIFFIIPVKADFSDPSSPALSNQLSVLTINPAPLISLQQPDILFIYWDATIIPPVVGQSKQTVNDVLKQQNAPSLDFDNILTLWSGKKQNEEQYDLTDYFAEEPEEYRQIKNEYNSIMDKIKNATINTTKSGLIMTMVTVAQKKIQQVVLVNNNQDATDTFGLAQQIIGYFDDIYKEIGVPNSSLPSNNMIGLAADINQQYNNNICWAIVNDNNQIFRAMSANCIPFFVGDVSTLSPKNRQNKNIMITNFNDINYLLLISAPLLTK